MRCSPGEGDLMLRCLGGGDLVSYSLGEGYLIRCSLGEGDLMLRYLGEGDLMLRYLDESELMRSSLARRRSDPSAATKKIVRIGTPASKLDSLVRGKCRSWPWPSRRPISRA